MSEPTARLARPAAGAYALPRSVRLVAWGGAALRGAVSLDEAVAAVTAGDDLHRVDGVPGEDDAIGLSLALGRLRAGGATGLRLVLPAPGDLAGLPGPPELNVRATDAGEVALTDGGPRTLALLPTATALGSSGTAVRWSVVAANTPRAGDLPGLADAERELAETVREATEVLAALDVARPDPAATDALTRLRSGIDAQDVLAPDFSGRAGRVLALAVRIGAIAALADASGGGAVTARELAARAQALRPLRRASRRALAAAANSPLEPTFR